MKQTSKASPRNKKTKTGSSAQTRQQRPNTNSQTNSRMTTGGQPESRVQNTGERNGRQANSSSGRNQSQNSSRQQGRGEGSFSGDSLLQKFFLDQLQDIYYAEKKIIQSLPKMQEAATTDELKDAFEDHLNQTQRHVKRLEKVFEALGEKAEGKKCEAIEGIAREVESIIQETEEGTMTRDAALIIAAQKVEHYEIATYGGLVQLAITMQLHEAADLLDKTLIEEEDTDALLTEIAENEINLGAEHEGSTSMREGAGNPRGSSVRKGQEGKEGKAGEEEESGMEGEEE